MPAQAQAALAEDLSMSGKAPCIVTLSILLSIVAAAPLLADPPLRMSLDGNEVVVTDIEPGTEVACLLFSRTARNNAPYNERQDGLFADSDGDGEVRISLSEAPPPKFVAVAVELSSGRFDVLTPEGSPAREVALPAHALLANPNDDLDRLKYQSSYLELLLVRPPDGVWRLTTGDGTPSDEGASSDGWVLTSPQFLQPVDGGIGPPDTYEAGDLLFGISPMTMEYFAARVVRQP
jgi:hypothetical protein